MLETFLNIPVVAAGLWCLCDILLLLISEQGPGKRLLKWLVLKSLNWMVN